MRNYIALKAMKFDKYYQKGDSIPENVIAKDMINKLIRCGVLVEGEEIEQQETEQQETEQQETGQQESGQHETEQQLLQYKKEELEQMAEQKGIEVKQGMTKADIVALLLQKE